MELTATMPEHPLPGAIENIHISTENETGLSFRKTVGTPYVDNPRMTCRDVEVYYGETCAINNISIDVGKGEVLAMIGSIRMWKINISPLPQQDE